MTKLDTKRRNLLDGLTQKVRAAAFKAALEEDDTFHLERALADEAKKYIRQVADTVSSLVETPPHLEWVLEGIRENLLNLSDEVDDEVFYSDEIVNDILIAIESERESEYKRISGIHTKRGRDTRVLEKHKRETERLLH